MDNAEQIFNEIKEASIAIWEENGRSKEDIDIMRAMLFTTHNPIVFYRMLDNSEKATLKNELSLSANNFIDFTQLI